MKGAGRQRRGRAVSTSQCEPGRAAGCASTTDDPESVPGPIAPVIAVATFRAASALDAKNNSDGEPLLSEVVVHLEHITKAVLAQTVIEKKELFEALGPVLAGQWEDQRVEQFCTTCWQATKKAALRKSEATASKKPHSGPSGQAGPGHADSNDVERLIRRERALRGLALLADHSAEQLIHEEQAGVSKELVKKLRSERRQQQRAKQAEQVASEVSPEADGSDARSEHSSTSSSDLKVRDKSNSFSILQDDMPETEKTDQGRQGVSSGQRHPAKARDGFKWTVKSYKDGTETTWDVLETDGQLAHMRIVGKEAVPLVPELGGVEAAMPQAPDDPGKSLSYSNTHEEEQSISMMRTVSSGTTFQRLMEDLEDVRSRRGNEGPDCQEFPLEGVGEESEADVVSSTADFADAWRAETDLPFVPATGSEADVVSSTDDFADAWRAEADLPFVPAAGSSQSSSMRQSPIGTPSGLCPVSPPPGLEQTLDAASSQLIGDSAAAGARPHVGRAPGSSSCCPGSPALLPKGSQSWMPLALGQQPPHSGRGRKTSSERNSSGSLFSRQLSVDSFSTDRDASSRDTPVALFPSTPDFCQSPAGSFMLPPLQPSIVGAGALPSQAQDGVTATSPQVIYVPVLVPHRCRNCGHECSPSDVPQDLLQQAGAWPQDLLHQAATGPFSLGWPTLPEADRQKQSTDKT